MIIMIRVKKLSEVIGKNVYTSEGDFFGQVDELSLSGNKIDGWKIRVGNSFVPSFGGARGVVIPHQFVKAIGDVVVVNKGSLPIQNEMPSEIESSSESSSGSSSSSFNFQ
jgi:sporulation protein YlmC with PRC-barrel domain